jgi:hypothetical protein
MIPPAFHGYHPDIPDRVSLVTVEPSTARELFLIRVERGPGRWLLRPVSLLGPYPEEEIAQRFADVVQDLRSEGYQPGGVLALLSALHDSAPGVRSLAALRLGWRRVPEAVVPLLDLLPAAVDETCSFLDALGMIGDNQAVPALREYAQRKLLSRRRSAVEALRQLGDTDGIVAANQRALERLPVLLRAIVESETPGPAGPRSMALAEAFVQLSPQEQALALDTLHELANPVTVGAVRLLLPQLTLAQVHLWRGVKSVLKRSLLRHDQVTFGLVSYEIERQGRTTKGTMATVKSGYDGSQRTLPIFARKTQDYLRRLGWRYLRDLAWYQPETYARTAAEALIHHTPDDGLHQRYLLHRILLGASKRYRFSGRHMRFSLRNHKAKQVPAGVREESFPDLWDAQPRAFLRLLSAARSPQVQEFAFQAIESRHPLLVREASHGEVLAMLQAPYPPTVELALAELDRRFDPEQPDWSLLRQMLDDDRPLARTLGQRWLRLTGHLWLRDPDRLIDFLGIRQPNLRALVIELAAGSLRAHPELRQVLAERLLTILRAPEAHPGGHAGYAALIQEALVEEFAHQVSAQELAEWLSRPSTAVQVLAGQLLKQRPDAVAELGLARLTAMAGHEIAVVRTAAHALLRAALPLLRVDPAVLFVLVESDWEDTRTVAGSLLGQIDLAVLGLDGILGLLDSSRIDVQEVGKKLVRQHLPNLPASELVERLVEHPHASMRSFTLDLVNQHLPATRESLHKMTYFCRAALLDRWPIRSVKRQAIRLLQSRGVESRDQAEVAAAILGDIVRRQGREDFELALEALVRIKMAYPDVATTLELLGRDEG